MKIYLSTRMSGLPDSNYPVFAHYAKLWRDAGWEVLNPAEHFGGASDRTYLEYIEADIADLKVADAIAMLPRWDEPEARGSIWEYAIAKHLLKIPVYDGTKPFPPVVNAVALAAHGGLTLSQYRDVPVTPHPVTGAPGRWVRVG